MNRDGMGKTIGIVFLCLVTAGVFSENLFAEDGEKKSDSDSDKRLALHGRGNKPSTVLEGKANDCPQKRTTLSAPESYQRMKNPLPATDKDLLAGQTLFLVDAKPTCQACHGVSGNGLGIARLPKPSRNFTCWETMKDVSDGQLFWIIQNGSGDTAMPAYKALEEEQIWQLILYLRHFTE